MLAAADVRAAIVANPVGGPPVEPERRPGRGRRRDPVPRRCPFVHPAALRAHVRRGAPARPDVVVVGGAQIAVARDEDPTARGIARALNNRWGMGMSRYRRGAPSGPSDTVYLGAFRTEQLEAAGGWDEAFDTNQDFELNRRMGELGIVWFEASLEVGYRPRASLVDSRPPVPPLRLVEGALLAPHRRPAAPAPARARWRCRWSGCSASCWPRSFPGSPAARWSPAAVGRGRVRGQGAERTACCRCAVTL